MKPATPLRGLLSHLPSMFATLSLGVVCIGMPGQASAEAVDSELVLLVDVSNTGLNDTKFDSLMDSYASSFTSSDVLGSIQSGAYGRIAVSLMFYGNSSIQQVAIPWMSIGNATEAAQFASLLSGVTRPVSTNTSDIAYALNAAVPTFGTETGGVANGFESSLQIIELAASTKPAAAGVRAASNAALAAGVDSVNAIAVGRNATRATNVADFLNNRVVGSTLPGPAPVAQAAVVDSTLTAALTLEVSGNLARGVAVVPEPESFACLMAGLGFTLLLRRRS